MQECGRYTQKEFPPYRFIPGEAPHPTENPLGHSYGKPENVRESFLPDEWQRNEQYLFGVDLYNAFFWWESHEALESLWRAAPCHDCRDYLQGLIKISGAFIKWHLRQQRGVEYLYNGGIEHLGKVQRHHGMFMGLDLQQHLEKLAAHFEPVIKNRCWTDPLNGYPYIVLTPFTA